MHGIEQLVSSWLGFRAIMVLVLSTAYYGEPNEPDLGELSEPTTLRDVLDALLGTPT